VSGGDILGSVRAQLGRRNGFNGTERNGYAVTTLAEGIS
jgi:hypothetical protein